MRWHCLWLVVFFASGGMLLAAPSSADRLGPPASGDLFGRMIGIETNAGSTVTALAGELKDQLEDMTGMEFAVAAAPAHAGGILLLRTADDLHLRYPGLADHAVKLAALTGCGTEAYCLLSSGADVLYIVGNSDAALSLAVYDYLWRQDDGAVLGTISVPSSAIAGVMTTYAWPFDGGRLVELSPGRRYFLTTEFGAGSGASEYYYFTSSFGSTATKANTWGGTEACVPIQSAAGGSWSGVNWTAPTLYPSRSEYDLWFRIVGDVIDASAGWHDGSLLIVR